MTAALHRRPNHLVIDSGSVMARVRTLRERVGPGVRIFAALKADGYGFGTFPMARAALGAGADALAMLDRAEALALREAGIEVPILLYAGAPLDADGVAAAVRHRLILTILSAAEIERVGRLATGPVELAIKLEIGAERLGVLPDDLMPMARAIAATPNLQLAVVNAHPTFGDGAPDAVLLAQFERYMAAVEGLAAAGLPMPLRLFASSRSLGRRTGMELDAIDPGQYLFSDMQDRPIIRSLSSVLMQVRPVTRDFAPEHAPFDIGAVTRIGVIPFGTVDGGGRCHGPTVLVNDRPAPILGPSLEYMRLDLSNHPDAQPGDEVVLIGRQGGAEIALREICEARGCRPHELAGTIGPAVLRHYTTETAR